MSGKMGEILQQLDKLLHPALKLGGKYHWLGGEESSVPATHLYLKKTRGQWGPPYHLATDCGLQGIHQLCRD